MKLTQLQEAGYATNYYAVEWCDETGECSGFVGPTQARVGKYQVIGETNDLFKPDYNSYLDTSIGFLEVAPTLNEARERMKFGTRPWHVSEFQVSDQGRTKFGKLIGKSPDVEHYEDPSVPAYIHEARYHGTHPIIKFIRQGSGTTQFPTSDLKVITDAITDEFGEPDIGDGHEGDPDHVNSTQQKRLQVRTWTVRNLFLKVHVYKHTSKILVYHGK